MKFFLNKPATLILTFLLVFMASTPVFAAIHSNDYESHWAEETIQSAISSGIAEGYLDGSFKPDNAITRAEFSELVNNVFSFTETAEILYMDVPSDAWYSPVIEKAKAAGYIEGYTDGTIKPDGKITRQEVAVIISRLKSLTTDSATLSFNDTTSIASWSEQSVIGVANAELMIGYPNGTFKPIEPITRAEALVSITRAFDYKTTEIVEDDTDVTSVDATDVISVDNSDNTSEDDTDDTPVDAINVSKTAMTLTEGGPTGEIIATITPLDAINQEVIWTSSDTSVATVENGIVTPQAEGFALITAASSEDETIIATTEVNVIIENQAEINTVNLGAAGNYVILAKTGISTVPNSVITGNIGVSPIDATALTGFSLTADASNEFSISDQVTGKVYAADNASPTPSNLTTAISDMETAYTDAAGRATNYTELYSGDISGKTLTAGVYKWGTGVLITSDVILDGNSNDVWIFQIGEGITQASGTKIILTGGAQAKNIFWQTAETVSIGTGSHFEGNILSMTNITLGTNASVTGRLLAQTAVTLDVSTVVAP